ncbi:MAG TPA: carboxypeptidase regulatory-like domain-containing protein, partial [Bacteroidetes bacterium]|nr:carboxypeptidase regulatory-like domain-containing protein [Bacteroidota bacterium]
MQIDIDTEEWEAVEQAQAWRNNDASSNWLDGIGHDGYNIWVGTNQTDVMKVVDDGIEESYIKWVMPEPDEGVVEADGSTDITLTFIPEEAEEDGVHEMYLIFELSEPDEERDDLEQEQIIISVIMSLNSPTANVSGIVTDAATDNPIEGVKLEIADHFFARFTDENGAYSADNIPLGNYEVTVTAADYLPFTEEVQLEEEGDLEWNIALLHSEFTPSQDEFEVALEPDLSYTFDFEVENGGNGPLTYSATRRLLGGANADPWDIRIDTNAEEAAQDNQLNGLVVVDGMFYVSGGNNAEDVNKIYVFNGDGELQREFDQFHESRYGMRDLTWDGSLIWGADGTTLYGFNTDGELIETVEGQARSYRSLTWDPDHELFWSADVTSDIFSTDPEGNEGDGIEVVGDTRIYGLSYWADDPDGYCLYVFSRGEREGVDIQVNKVNVEDGDMVLVRELGVDGRPGGINITNQYDVYSQVLAGIVQSPDRIVVWQLEARRDWFQIDPEAGQIAAGESAGFQLTLDATGLPVDNTFEGEVVFTHDGVGGETILSATLDVVEGEVHTFRDLDLGIGWNLVSANLQPDDEDVEVIMSDLVDAGLLIMMKDGAGHF